MKTPTVVCLCGSTRFKSEFIEQNERLTVLDLRSGRLTNVATGVDYEHVVGEVDLPLVQLVVAGEIVLTVGMFGHADDKIDWSSPEGRELKTALAVLQGKPVKYLESI